MTNKHEQDMKNLRKQLNKILKDEPSDEELEYDEELLELYAEVHNLDESMKDNGF